MEKIATCLWYETQAEEAANFYVSIFKNSRIGVITHYGDASAQVSGQPKGSVLTVEFEIAGQKFTALNGGPLFKFNESVSFVINCDTQEEIDYFWEKLTQDGGKESMCGWLKDKFGLSWQVVPALISDLMTGDPGKSERVMRAILQMKKLDLATLKAAAEQE
jgi:predicted 3-demethylubiquinone-9 3-methyltransferase (glyoxalase superfamily)